MNAILLYCRHYFQMRLFRVLMRLTQFLLQFFCCYCWCCISSVMGSILVSNLRCSIFTWTFFLLYRSRMKIGPLKAMLVNETSAFMHCIHMLISLIVVGIVKKIRKKQLQRFGLQASSMRNQRSLTLVPLWHGRCPKACIKKISQIL